jgi:hypothetical protein
MKLDTIRFLREKSGGDACQFGFHPPSLAFEGSHSGKNEERLLRVPRVTGLVQIE